MLGNLFQRANLLLGEVSRSDAMPRLRDYPQKLGGGTSPVDILLLDVSGSMADTDYPPSRLEGAKVSALRFAEKRAAVEPDSRVGVVSFSDSATVVCSPVPV